MERKRKVSRADFEGEQERLRKLLGKFFDPDYYSSTRKLEDNKRPVIGRVHLQKNERD